MEVVKAVGMEEYEFAVHETQTTAKTFTAEQLEVIWGNADEMLPYTKRAFESYLEGNESDEIISSDTWYEENDKYEFELRRKTIVSNIKLRNTYKSYTAIFVIGILVGCICRLLDYFPADTLWSFSSPQTLFGFWIITNTIIVMLSTSNICAGISSFLYMFGMTLSFYFVKSPSDNFNKQKWNIVSDLNDNKIACC